MIGGMLLFRRQIEMARHELEARVAPGLARLHSLLAGYQHVP